MISFGVAYQALLDPKRDSSIDLFADIMWRPYWQMYGELFLEDVDEGMGEHAVSLCMVGFHCCTKHSLETIFFLAIFQVGIFMVLETARPIVHKLKSFRRFMSTATRLGWLPYCSAFTC